MNKNKLGVVFSSLVVLFSVVLLANYFSATRDVSWIRTLKDYIQEENWEPDQEYEPLADWAFFLYENETEQFFISKSRLELISFINGLMNDVDRQVHTSISKDSLDEMLVKDKILIVVHRFSTKSSLWTPPNSFANKVDYDKLYFVLEDNSINNLKGTIIVREHYFESQEINYSVWQLSNGFLW